MIINHNMNAMTAHRQMGINTGNQGKAIEKLSSGQRINRAGDDAAGLAISEKMRGQIRGLDGASRNAQDGVSLIQTAEGALNETHNILQRMRELSVQGANDTNVTEDRQAIQKEMAALTEEIDRISTDTEFNGQKLLNGSFSGKLQIGANEGQNVDLNIGKMNSSNLGLTSTISVKEEVSVTAGKIADGEYTIKGTELLDSKGNSIGKFAEADNEITLTDGTTKIKFEKADLADGSTIKIEGGKATTENKIQTGASGLASGNYKIDGTNLVKDGEVIGIYDGTAKKITLNDGNKTEITEAQLGFVATKLIDGVEFTINGIDISNHEKSTASIKTLDSAIEKVSSQRAGLGALQNRLEHTIATNDNSAENLQAAESRIRDVDMAKEMMNLSKNNVLVQAAQSMLGQANQQPNQVLSLLR